MNCDAARKSFASYIEGSLPDDQQRLVTEHFERCKSCRDGYESILHAWKTLDLWEDVEPPVHMKKDAMQKLRDERLSDRLHFLLPVAAVLVIAMTIFLFYGREDHRSIRDMASSTDSTTVKIKTAGKEISEEEIISNLQILQDKDFYDAFDTLKKIDLLPLADDFQENHHYDKKSSLEFLPA